MLLSFLAYCLLTCRLQSLCLLLPLVPTVYTLPRLADWHITLIAIGALALVVGTVISIILRWFLTIG